MALVQQSRNVAQLNEKEEAKINEAVEEAKSLLANNAKASQQEFAIVFGAIKDDQMRALSLHETHSYKGKFIADPPQSLPRNGTGAFANEGAAYDGKLPVVVGPKAAIIYGHLDKLPGQQLAWLLAYHKPADPNAPNKVYVEAGGRSRITNLKWSQIEEKLDASGDISRYWDSETGASAVAKIQNHDGKLAFLGANFSKMD